MIYFDNAATTKDKPEEVYKAFEYYIRKIGVSPGRGSYSLGIEASRMLYKSRTAVGKYFGLSKPDRVIFTKNSTEAINLFFNGFLKRGDHVLISCYEHNAVLRPLHYLKEKGLIEYTIISNEDLQLKPNEIFRKYVRNNTRLIALTLASNLTGRIVWTSDITKCFKEKGVTTFIDSSQGAGKLSINMNDDGVDYLAFTGHKDLYSIPGVGGLCCQSSEKINPLIQGGTGIHGENYTNPIVFPEGYEAGTLNMPAIWSLQASINFINENRELIAHKEMLLMKYLLNRLKEIPDIIVYDLKEQRVSTCCISKPNVSSDQLVRKLDHGGICSRGGIHCAILAHETLGTVSTGLVRLSLSYKNTEDEIDTLINILKSIGD